VNIALELVTDPVILFLDEPTSGLAADDTTTLIALLADLTKKTGKTIVMRSTSRRKTSSRSSTWLHHG